MAMMSFEAPMGENPSWEAMYKNGKKYKPRICDSKTKKMRPLTKEEWKRLLCPQEVV